jgi:hypothetical protein
MSQWTVLGLNVREERKGENVRYIGRGSEPFLVLNLEGAYDFDNDEFLAMFFGRDGRVIANVLFTSPFVFL